MARVNTPAASRPTGVTAGAGTGLSAQPRERRFNTEDVSAQLLRTLQPLHVDSLSLHDAAGVLLWLNEGAFGPDEHGVVTDALDVFALDPSRKDLQLKLDDDRSALVSTARDANAEICGIALVIVETPQSEEICAKLASPRLVALMRRFAQLLAPAAAPAAAPVIEPVSSPEAVTRSAARAAAAAEEFTIGDPLARSEPSESLSLEMMPTEPAVVRVERRARPVTSPVSADKIAVSGETVHAHRYARLRAGGAARRYEVKMAQDASFAADLELAKHVIKHLQRSGDRYTQAPASFAIPLSAQSVIQPGWVSQLQPRLTRAGLPDGLVGFCLPPAAWQLQPAATERFIAQCEQAHCFVALDDFNLSNSGLGLLRWSAVKCLKIDSHLIATVVQDKFAHASLAAIVQAARVLGLYCVAKKVSSSSQVKWLAGAGIEFADGVSRGVAAAATKSDEALMLQSEG